ncbi:hypothetical protein [Streptomyces sp. NBC_01565]|uniref:hypothetical protein n=1 Tax=Streptomyces sp. NBC_01565 TaxID=2975881 RepID=UPI002252BA66|nr:hypothetical protein [Streptomyces sp. NBC_01565]MCX4543751.1 hypothetical protein [Streptomyces sp. NBC_01565]
MAIELTGERADELIQLQRASDAAHEAVRADPSPEAWASWRERAGEIQAAVTAYAVEIGQPRNEVEAAVKKAARYPAES